MLAGGGVLADLDAANNVGMIRVGYDASRTVKAVDVGLAGRQLLGQNLDGHLPVRLFLVAKINRAHASFAKPPQDLVLADAPQLQTTGESALSIAGPRSPGPIPLGRRRKGCAGLTIGRTLLCRVFVEGGTELVRLGRAKKLLLDKDGQDVDGSTIGLAPISRRHRLLEARAIEAVPRGG